jgi:hypothetical protein
MSENLPPSSGAQYPTYLGIQDIIRKQQATHRSHGLIRTQPLGDFRSWFRRDYLRTKFPSYVLSKASTLIGGRATAERIAAVFEAPKIEKKK